MKSECYKCHKTDCLLVAIHAPGLWYLCDDCVRKQELEDGTVAILYYSSGLKFVSPEKATLLGEKGSVIDE